jgi:hypothetical protein
VAVGRVVRSTRGMAAVKIDRYQFKTRGRTSCSGGSAAKA